MQATFALEGKTVITCARHRLKEREFAMHHTLTNSFNSASFTMLIKGLPTPHHPRPGCCKS